MSENQNKLYKDIVLEVDIDAKKGAKNQVIETHATFYSYDIQSGLIKINIKKDSKPLPLPNGTQILLSVVKLDLPQQKMVFTGDIVDSTEGIAHWVIPDELQGYKGDIRAGVFIKLPNNQRLHGGYFRFHMGISEIDENLFPFEESYWQGWHDFQKEAEQEWNAWKANRDKTWREHEEAYDEWKKQQVNKQKQYENDTDERWNKWKNQQEKAQSEFESNFVSWESTQGNKQKQFESDFQSWKDTQVNKQSEFEEDQKAWEQVQKDKLDEVAGKISELDISDTNLLTGTSDSWIEETWSSWGSQRQDFYIGEDSLKIGDTLTYSIEIDNTVDDVNDTSVLARLSFYDNNDNLMSNQSTSGNYINGGKKGTSVVTDKIPEGTKRLAIFGFYKNGGSESKTAKARKHKLQKGNRATDWTPAPEDLATKQELDVKVDKTSFDNFTEHGFLSVESGFKNADGDNASTSMQYMRVGNLMNIFGAVANQKVLNKDSDHLVVKLPERLKVFINDTRVCQASGNDLFTARINESESENYPNQIFIYRFRGGNGISKDFSANRWLNISLTCAVEVVD